MHVKLEVYEIQLISIFLKNIYIMGTKGIYLGSINKNKGEYIMGNKH